MFWYCDGFTGNVTLKTMEGVVRCSFLSSNRREKVKKKRTGGLFY